MFSIHMEVQQIQHGTEGRISNADVSSPYNQPDTTARHLKELTSNTKDKCAHN